MGSGGLASGSLRPKTLLKAYPLAMKISTGYGGLLLTLVVAACHGLAIPANDAKEDNHDRDLSSLGGGNILRSLDVLPTYEQLVEARQLSQLGGGNILRDLSALGGGNILRSLQDAPPPHHRMNNAKRTSFDLIDSHRGFGRFVKRGMFDPIDNGAGFGRFVKRTPFDLIDQAAGFGRRF